MKTKKQLKKLSKSELIDYVISVEDDLDRAVSSNIELSIMLHESRGRIRKIMLKKGVRI